MGSHAAWSLAEPDPRADAAASESVYDRPPEMLRLLLNRYAVGSLPLLPNFAEKPFHCWKYREAAVPSLERRWPALAGVPKLFFEVSDNSDPVRTTALSNLQVPKPKQQATILHGKYAVMLDEEKRRYENRIVSFFFEAASLEPHYLGLSWLPFLDSTIGLEPWARRMANHA